MAAPIGLTIQKYSRLRCRLDWADAGADSYTIERKIAGGSWGVLASGVTVLYYVDETSRTRGAIYYYRVTSVVSGSPAGTSTQVATKVPSRLLMIFSDSSTAFGANGRTSGYTSYASQLTGQGKRTYYQRVDPNLMPDSPFLLSGKVTALTNENVETVNHGQAGYFANQWGRSTVNINGHTPFYAEACGREGTSPELFSYYDGGDDYPFNQIDPDYSAQGGGQDRVNAQVPTESDWLYIQYGGNDILPPQWPWYSVSETLAAISQMVSMWEAQGGLASRVMISTIPPLGNSLGWEPDPAYDWHPSQIDGTDISDPGAPNPTQDIRLLNNGIRALCQPTVSNGPILIDTVAMCSDDNGLNWKDQIEPITGLGYNSPWHISGDDNHFSEDLFDLMAAEIVSVMNADAPINVVDVSIEQDQLTMTAWTGATSYYKLDDAVSWTAYSAPIDISGVKKFQYYASDGIDSAPESVLFLGALIRANDSTPLEATRTKDGAYLSTRRAKDLIN